MIPEHLEDGELSLGRTAMWCRHRSSITNVFVIVNEDFRHSREVPSVRNDAGHVSALQALVLHRRQQRSASQSGRADVLCPRAEASPSPLRPGSNHAPRIDIGRILDHAFDMYRKHWKLLLQLSASIYLISALLIAVVRPLAFRAPCRCWAC